MTKKPTGIICGDSSEVLKTLDSESIDLVVTSPPYDNLRTYNGYSFDFETIAAELVRTLKPGGVIVWVVGDATVNGSETGTSFKQALYFMGLGLNLHDTMIYQKSVPPMNDRRYQHSFEYMFVFSKGIPTTYNPIMVDKNYNDKRKSKNFHRYANGDYAKGFSNPASNKKPRENIWKIFAAGGSSDKIASQHPAIFPEQLAADHIRSWSNEGDTVLDPFNGSGTTTKMAYQLNRNYIGIEISQEYCDIANKRLEQGVLL